MAWIDNAKGMFTAAVWGRGVSACASPSKESTQNSAVDLESPPSGRARMLIQSCFYNILQSGPGHTRLLGSNTIYCYMRPIAFGPKRFGFLGFVILEANGRHFIAVADSVSVLASRGERPRLCTHSRRERPGNYAKQPIHRNDTLFITTVWSWIY